MSRVADWEEEGRDVGVALDACHAVVVVGSDPVATAEVALGIARVQAQHRRVTVADLFGEAEPLQSLVTDSDAPGLMDSFEFGVSLNRVAYPVAEDGELFVMPSGATPVDHAAIVAHPRWRQLAASQADSGALLLIAAPTDAPFISTLVEMTDGAVLVGEQVPPDVPVARSLAWIMSRRSHEPRPSGSVPPAHSAPQGITAAEETPAAPRRYVAALSGLAIAAALAAAAVWFLYHPDRFERRTPPGVAATSPAVASVTAGTLSPGPGTPVSVAPPAPAPAPPLVAAPANDSFPVLPAANAADSVKAAAFAVELEQTFTPAGAILNIATKYKGLPAASYAFTPATRFYQVVVGAYESRAAADSLLARVRAMGTLPPNTGRVVSVPFAFLVQSDVPAAQVAARVTSYTKKFALPVYALRQPDGAATLYFGAYENPQQAALAVPAVRKAGLTPTLVYRIGRVF